MQLRVFWGTLIAMFVMVTLQLFGIKAPQLVMPLPQKADVFYDKVSPQLEKKQNTYRLQEENSFIPKAGASAAFEDAAGYAVIDFDSGEVLGSKNLSKQLPIASLTKIMTSVVALDLANPDELFTVTQTAADKIPTKIGVRVGEQLTVEELLHAALLTSGNDATEVLKDGIDAKYGRGVFIRAMNEKAHILGLTNSSFANAQGFDDVNNYSSVEDVAILSHYALTNYPLLAEIAKKDYMFLPANEHHKQFDLYNWNGLIGVYPRTMGLKIGNTGDAGKTTVVFSERNNKKMLAVVLGAPGILERDLWAAQLLDLGYKTSSNLTAIDVTEEQLRAKYATWQSWN